MTTRTITGGTFAIASLIDGSMLRDTHFTGVTLTGPAVFAAGSFRFEGIQNMDGTLEAVIWDVPEGRTTVAGAVLVQNCTFVDCTFRQIGFAMQPGTVDQFIKNLTIGNHPEFG
ncbi:hypothetical protein [Herbiconiux solani]|uniref:hypothetical protein n=1 Tax=Herbiconiux solani TaxID=661329 RepID=UPI00082428CB|nr:hypothetical protein [Herbiconiux solani]